MPYGYILAHIKLDQYIYLRIISKPLLTPKDQYKPANTNTLEHKKIKMFVSFHILPQCGANGKDAIVYMKLT